MGFEKETLACLTDVQKISDESGIAMADLAIKWIISNTAINCCLAGSRTLKQLKQNVDAAALSLDLELKLALDKATIPLMKVMGNYMDYYEAADSDRTI